MPVISTEAKHSGAPRGLFAATPSELFSPAYRTIALALLLASCVSARSQEQEKPLPLVTSGQMAFYPLGALHARIEGVVKIKVTTDGKNVTAAYVVSGPPMLAQAAKANILTWHLEAHKPAEFIATYEYVITEPSQCEFTNGTTTAQLPLQVRVTASGLQTCDPATTATKILKR